MTKEDIIKALTCCSNPSISYCKDCPYANYGEFDCCNGKMCKDALDLIIEQEREIEQLKADYAKLQEQFAQYQMASNKKIKAQIKQAKIDVMNELKTHSYYDDYYIDSYVFVNDIDELIEEVQND